MKLTFKKFDHSLKQLQFFIEINEGEENQAGKLRNALHERCTQYLGMSLQVDDAISNVTVNHCISIDAFLCDTKQCFLDAGINKKHWEEFAGQLKQQRKIKPYSLDDLSSSASSSLSPSALRKYGVGSRGLISPPIARSSWAAFKSRSRAKVSPLTSSMVSPQPLASIREPGSQSWLENSFYTGTFFPTAIDRDNVDVVQIPTLATIIDASNSRANDSDSLHSKYNNTDLLNHQLFQKVLYVFCINENSQLHLEFYIDAVKFRTELHKDHMTINQEAKILYDAYISLESKKHISYLSEDIQTNIKLAIFQPDSSSASTSLGITRLLFLSAEREVENFLIASSLFRFKKTADFREIMPFVTFDKKQKIKNEEIRKKLKLDEEMSILMTLPQAAEEQLNLNSKIKLRQS